MRLGDAILPVKVARNAGGGAGGDGAGRLREGRVEGVR